VDIRFFVELSGVLITETSPFSFNQLYDILESTFSVVLYKESKKKTLLRAIQKQKRIQWKLSIDAEVLVS
jgi:hypothetical protein